MSQQMWGTLREFHDRGGVNLIGSAYLPGGKQFFVDGANGNDARSGISPDQALLTLGAAHALCTSGNNDVTYLIGNGLASGSARLSATLALTKDATHIIGITAPTLVNSRARIATTSGATAFANMVTNTGDGCIFSNISIFHGFGTGTTSQICWTDTGERNYYNNVWFGGMGDQTSADDAGSRSLKIGSGGNGEHTFENCVIGLDTITRGAANASLELTGATPRNTFRNCYFPFQTDASSPLGIIGTGGNFMDRWCMFDNCSFINNIRSSSTAMSVLATLNATPNGMLIFKDCLRIGVTVLAVDGAGAEDMYAVYGGVAPSSPDALGLALPAST